MNKIFALKTNLPRTIVWYCAIVMGVFGYYLLDKSIGILIVFGLTIVLFIQFIFSKELFGIVIYEEDITFEYLQLIKKRESYKLSKLLVKRRIEFKFRGGRDEILEIYGSDSKKKLFEISFKLFKSSDDYKKVIEILNIDLNT